MTTHSTPYKCWFVIYTFILCMLCASACMRALYSITPMASAVVFFLILYAYYLTRLDFGYIFSLLLHYFLSRMICASSFFSLSLIILFALLLFLCVCLFLWFFLFVFFLSFPNFILSLPPSFFDCICIVLFVFFSSVFSPYHFPSVFRWTISYA